MHDILSKSEKTFRHCCLSRLNLRWLSRIPPEVAASDLIPGYKPPFLERTLVCIEPQNLEDDDLMMFADRELDMMMMFISICAGD